MGLPPWLLRKLYRKGSLSEGPDDTFCFDLQNRLGTATLIAPPRFVINGVAYLPEDVRVEGVDIAAIGPNQPFEFARGSRFTLHFPGRLLRGGNRIHGVFYTREFGELELFLDAPLHPMDDSEE